MGSRAAAVAQEIAGAVLRNENLTKVEKITFLHPLQMLKANVC
jgi:hypothetical protein